MDYFDSPLMLGLGLSLMAGAATGIGAAVAFFMKNPSTRVLAFALGSSAGVMIYISFMELLPEAQNMAEGNYAKWITLAAFFGGMLLSGLIDSLVPEDENPHELHGLKEWESAQSDKGLKRSAYLFAAAIAIHNFPEGVATVAAAFDSATTASAVALAVAIHNLPEGIAVAIPLYCATGDKWKSFFWATLSGLAEPLGGLVAMLVLMPFITPTLLSILFASVAGIMIFISLDELLPMARRWGHNHATIYGTIFGMLIMGFVL